MIARFDVVIAGFKRVREHLLERRVGAADHVMVELDDRLAVNSRTLEALERSRDLTINELRHAEAQRDRDINPRLVVVDDHPEGRAFLAKILHSHFPRAEILECKNSEVALAELRSGRASVFLVHRADDADGLPLVELLRAASPTVPIVYVSSVDRNDAAMAAGATTFLLYDQSWLIGREVGDILSPPSSPATP
jgi:CheY-like chemotaxis protein